MDCATSYAVVLDQEGRFYTVPNLGYTVGDVLEDVVLFDTAADVRDESTAPARRRNFQVVRWLAAAACFVALAIGGFAFWQTPIGVVRMQINPEVSMDVNRFDRVVGIEGENADGIELIEGYQAYGKDIETVTSELADRSREQRYLNPGDTIVIEVDSDDDAWTAEVEERIVVELDKYMNGDAIVITAEDAARAAAQKQAREERERLEQERAVQAQRDATAEENARDGGQSVSTPAPAVEVAPTPAPTPTPAAPTPASSPDDDDDDDDGDDDDDDSDDDDDDDDDD